MMRRLHAFALLGFCLGAASVRTAGAQPRTLYRATEDFRPVEVRAVDDTVMRRDVLPWARRTWRGTELCDDEFQVVDAAYGAFTERGMSQRAVLYRYCKTGHDRAKGGVAILQNGRVLAHFTIEGAEPDGIRRMPDVDRNGVAELLLVDNSTHQGETSTVVSLLQLEGRGVRAMGTIGVYHGTLGTRGDGGREEASILYALPGPRPRFEMETWGHDEGSRARWIGTEKLHRVTLRPDRVTYRRVR